MSYLHAALLALAALTQPPLTGKVVSVTDGDTHAVATIELESFH